MELLFFIFVGLVGVGLLCGVVALGWIAIEKANAYRRGVVSALPRKPN
jgi:hypothetical protein